MGATDIFGVRYCEVLSVTDTTDSDMIQVRLHPEDDDIKTDKDLPYAFPLLPKMIHVKPKVGESVLILLSVTSDGYSAKERYYIGPVISQDNKLYKDSYLFGGASYQPGALQKFNEAPSMDPKKDGIFPENDDVCLRGRKNADIQITEDDVRIRAGVKLADETNKQIIRFNENDPAYIKLKYHPGGLINEAFITKLIEEKYESKKEAQRQANKENGIQDEIDNDINTRLGLQSDGKQNKKQEKLYKEARNEVFEELGFNGEVKQCNSTATIVADKINLISNSSDTKFPIADKKDLTTDETMVKVLREAYKLPYGEKLVEILSMLIEAFEKHTHPFSMMEPCNSQLMKDLHDKKTVLLDDGQMLSDTVRIN